MAADEVIIARFRAELDQTIKEFDRYIASLEKGEKQQKSFQETVTETSKKTQAAGKKEVLTIEQYRAELARIEAAKKKAFDTKPIVETGKEIDKVKKKTKETGDSFDKSVSKIKSNLKQIATSLGIGFSALAVINFSKQSIDAFLEAEKNADRLRFAITALGGESEAVFNRLIQQSEDLQKITVFDDDSIQQAQAALAAFGLTGRQIEELIPKLADFATIMGTDLPTAANMVGAGLQGVGRELKRYGIEVSATATASENLNAIMEGFSRQSGAAENAAKTLSGQLEQLKNRSDDLQQEIGKDLIPAWTALKIAIFETTKTVFDYIKAGGDLQKFFFNQKIREQGTALEEIDKKLKQLTESNIKLGQSESEARKNAAIEIQKEIRSRVEVNEQRLRTATLTIQADKEQAELDKQRARNRRDASVNELKIINDIVDSLTKEEATKINILTLDELRAQSIERLNELLKENNLRNDINSQSNVKLIEREIEARKKAADEAAKELEKLKNKFGKLEIIIPLEFRFRKKPEEVVSEEIKHLREEFEKELGKKNQQRLNENAAESGKSAGGSWAEAFLKANEDIINITSQIVGELAKLFDTFSQKRIDQIDRETEKELSALDIRSEAIEDSLDKRRISEREAQEQQEALEKKKVEVQEAADKKIRELKRRQAIIDKVAALFQIAIDTARNAISQPGPAFALVPAWIALGAAQAAIVAATPIPGYKKGTKRSKEGVALVGEEGPEYTYLNEGSKVVDRKKSDRFAHVFDSIIDGKFNDEYVPIRDVAAIVRKRKESYSEHQSRSMAENIRNSIFLTQAGDNGGLMLLNRKGLNLSDQAAEKIGKSVADNLSFTSIYR